MDPEVIIRTLLDLAEQYPDEADYDAAVERLLAQVEEDAAHES